MNRYIFFLAFTGLTLFSCKKTVSPASQGLEGKWRMEQVKDNATGGVTTKASSITGEVDISFVPVSMATGFISGNTPTNQFTVDYTFGTFRTISCKNILSTEVAETSWGLLFMRQIAHANYYKLLNDGQQLIIVTSTKTFVFAR